MQLGTEGRARSVEERRRKGAHSGAEHNNAPPTPREVATLQSKGRSLKTSCPVPDEGCAGAEPKLPPRWAPTLWRRGRSLMAPRPARATRGGEGTFGGPQCSESARQWTQNAAGPDRRADVTQAGRPRPLLDPALRPAMPTAGRA